MKVMVVSLFSIVITLAAVQMSFCRRNWAGGGFEHVTKLMASASAVWSALQLCFLLFSW